MVCQVSVLFQGCFCQLTFFPWMAQPYFPACFYSLWFFVKNWTFEYCGNSVNQSLPSTGFFFFFPVLNCWRLQSSVNLVMFQTIFAKTAFLVMCGHWGLCFFSLCSATVLMEVSLNTNSKIKIIHFSHFVDWPCAGTLFITLMWLPASTDLRDQPKWSYSLHRSFLRIQPILGTCVAFSIPWYIRVLLNTLIFPALPLRF